jgi:hypothetical protein
MGGVLSIVITCKKESTFSSTHENSIVPYFEFDYEA